MVYTTLLHSYQKVRWVSHGIAGSYNEIFKELHSGATQVLLNLPINSKEAFASPKCKSSKFS